MITIHERRILLAFALNTYGYKDAAIRILKGIPTKKTAKLIELHMVPDFTRPKPYCLYIGKMKLSCFAEEARANSIIRFFDWIQSKQALEVAAILAAVCIGLWGRKAIIKLLQPEEAIKAGTFYVTTIGKLTGMSEEQRRGLLEKLKTMSDIAAQLGSKEGYENYLRDNRENLEKLVDEVFMSEKIFQNAIERGIKIRDEGFMHNEFRDLLHASVGRLPDIASMKSKAKSTKGFLELVDNWERSKYYTILFEFGERVEVKLEDDIERFSGMLLGSNEELSKRWSDLNLQKLTNPDLSSEQKEIEKKITEIREAWALLKVAQSGLRDIYASAHLLVEFLRTIKRTEVFQKINETLQNPELIREELESGRLDLGISDLQSLM